MSSDICRHVQSARSASLVMDSSSPGRVANLARNSFTDSIFLQAPNHPGRRTNSEDFSGSIATGSDVLPLPLSNTSPHGKVLWKKVQQFTHRLHRRMAELTPNSGPQTPDWVHFLQYQQQTQKQKFVKVSPFTRSVKTSSQTKKTDRSRSDQSYHSIVDCSYRASLPYSTMGMWEQTITRRRLRSTGHLDLSSEAHAA
ncbi:hypothetical protein Ciccas_006002, partial [Cichlidogyrus casuarinus]